MKSWYTVAGGYYQALLEYRIAVANLAMKCGSDELRRLPADAGGG